MYINGMTGPDSTRLKCERKRTDFGLETSFSCGEI